MLFWSLWLLIQMRIRYRLYLFLWGKRLSIFFSILVITSNQWLLIGKRNIIWNLWIWMKLLNCSESINTIFEVKTGWLMNLSRFFIASIWILELSSVRKYIFFGFNYLTFPLINLLLVFIFDCKKWFLRDIYWIFFK